MHQVKLFKGVENDLSGLEGEVNHWLRESGARVVQMFGNIAPQTMASGKSGSGSRTFDASDIFVAVVYETG